MNTRVGGYVIVQACDGRWNYGPSVVEQAMSSDEFGTFPTRLDATKAALKEITVREYAALSKSAKRIANSVYKA